MKDQLLYGIADTRGEAFVAILCARLKDLKASHVFLVRGKQSFVQCGAAEKIAEVQQKSGVHITEFSDFSANPKDEEAKNGVLLLLKERPDVIIAIGGGSVMDMAKLIRHYAAEQDCTVPLWAVPTTAGTGAEATHFAVVYKDGVKHSMEADDILPDVAILYPPFTYGNNAYLTACTGFDALAQAIEAFWNPNATDESDEFAFKAITALHRPLLDCIKDPDNTNLREHLLLGAYYAGRAINITKTTAPHAFSYAFTTHCGYPHGQAVAITFPYFAELNMTHHPKDARLRSYLGIGRDISYRQYFSEYISKIGLHYDGTKGKNLHELVSQVNLERLKNNPVVVTSEKIKELENYLNNQ